MFRVLKSKVLLPIFVITFISMFAASMIGAVNVLFALDLGATYIELGLITFSTGIVTMFIQIPLGILSDRLGRKPMLFIPELFILSADIIRGFATQPLHLIVASVFGGFAGGAFVPVIVSLVADSTEPSDKADSLSMYYFFSSLGLFVGPGAASLLLLFIPIRSLYYLSSILRLGIIVLIALGIKEVRRSHLEGVSYKGNVASLLKRRNMFVVMQARLGFSFFQSALTTYLPVLARQELELPNSLIAILGTFQGIARMGVRLSLGTLIRKLTAKRLLVLTLGLGGAVGLLMFFANSFYHLVLLQCVFGLSHGIDVPLSTLLVADTSTTAERGFANSLLYSSMTVGTFTPIITAPIAEGWGVAFVFPLVSILPIASALVTAWLMKPLSTEQDARRQLIEHQSQSRTLK